MHWKLPSGRAATDDVPLVWSNYMLDKDNVRQTITTSCGLEEKKLSLEYVTWELGSA